MQDNHFDVLIVGAGISGIGAAYHLNKRCPERSYVILEGREHFGGTWDLFRYPGIRSDSDMYTLGFSFKPWTHAKAIADAPAIMDYLGETINENGLQQHIRYGNQVKRANWSDETSLWTVEAESAKGEITRYSCNFLFMCSGYYNYAEGYTPEFRDSDTFKGEIIHPQHWPEELDYTGKRVVVIGSGATAVTIVPEMARDAEHVTMLQRSPTYMVSRPARSALGNGLRRFLPDKIAYHITRWFYIMAQQRVFLYCRKNPEKAKERILNLLREELNEDYDVETHFTPSYYPWEQRLCLVPDSDMFRALNNGSASIVTDHIERFTETGIKLKSGDHLDADIIVTATGLKMQFLSDLDIHINGQHVEPKQLLTYRGMMFSGVPNLAWSTGYTNASWTLKADLTSEYVCRLLKHMKQHGYTRCCPENRDGTKASDPLWDFSSGYVQRAMDLFPRQGEKAPWKYYQNYPKDILSLRLGTLDDGVMTFSNKVDQTTESLATAS